MKLEIIEKISKSWGCQLFALFLVLSVNVLLLNEPTNHLGLKTLNALEEAITY